MKAGGKAGVVIKNTFLSNTDNASIKLRQTLLENCNLHTVLDLPGGTFTGAGVKTVVLFFEKGSSTKKVWFYQLNLARNLGKTNPLNEKDLEDFVALQKTKADSPNSWTLDITDIAPMGLDTLTKGSALRKGAALMIKEAASTKALKGRNSSANDIAPSGLDAALDDDNNTGLHPVLSDNAPSGLDAALDGNNTGLHPVLSDNAPSGLGSSTYDLSAKNPNKKEEAALRQPQAILEEMKSLDAESADILNSILELI